MHGDDHDQGLEHDLAVLAARVERRRVLRWMAGAALLPLVGCGGSEQGGSACESEIPEETAGPYPGDGSNGANALVLSGIVRRDIRSSLAGQSGTAEGVPLTVTLTLVNSADGGCAPLAGYAVYLWHCDRDGKYSMYTLTNQNYLRGVQETGADGTVSFTTIFPGCYSGRMPHIHFEIYPSLSKATASGNKLRTSQLALPVDACDAVYATSGYSASVSNLARISFAQDNVFSDGTSLQLASVTGSAAEGYVATLTVGLSV
ncbi:intradiol ring-cleavage dioxygenase [Melittangium boletus]|uniref:intradiol ring-cleavage dioxygenase n=1 Tax=Melittangium boletus TaxID=83453 RepID=UPI003DA59F59